MISFDAISTCRLHSLQGQWGVGVLSEVIEEEQSHTPGSSEETSLRQTFHGPGIGLVSTALMTQGPSLCEPLPAPSLAGPLLPLSAWWLSLSLSPWFPSADFRCRHQGGCGEWGYRWAWLLRATMRSLLRSPAQVEGTQGFLPQPGKDLERPSSTRLEARVATVCTRGLIENRIKMGSPGLSMGLNK